MLGYIISEEPGQTDALLQQVAQTLMNEIPLVGAVQHTSRLAPNQKQDMALHVLPNGPKIPISQNLGKLAAGCTLDPEGLETAAGLIAASLDSGPRLLLLNKFGKQEAEGQGFRAVIGTALARDIPVLIGVGREKISSFQSFTGDFAEEIPKDPATILAWCRAQTQA
ncbi:DUF2478 domain-containing protein [Thalassovita sp.]|uniref:DUF2478 domain-containing protein n=1 Tax=Thalassovita sp. TaxID=1979401 RepID=UPI0028819E08|nr:DUF2478 domain-containing protein [Thalassovita sp.]MDF1803860.1 DUF2478 domain-containing protein [Thalassovita sp.]